jgi:hypothetical protein
LLGINSFKFKKSGNMIKHFTTNKKVIFSVNCYLLIVILLISFTAKGQYPASSYTFTQTSGTYTPITGGTLIASSIPDYASYPSIALTPGFNFCGTVYTNAFVTTDGLITLGGISAVNVTNGISTSTVAPLLCPFNADMIGSSAAGAAPGIRYQLVGNEHVFQWSDISRWPSATDRFSFQARLNYVTGTITYVYSVTSVGTATSYQPVIGIRTANTTGNWQNRLVANDATSSWAASAAGTTTGDVCRFTSSTINPKQPATGQTYIYTPPPACNVATGLPTAGTTTVTPGTVCVSQNVTLSFTPATPMPPTTGITYQWQSAPAAAGPWTNVGTPTTATTYTTATPVSTPLFFRAQVLCNGTTTLFNSAPSAQVIVSNPGTPTITNGARCGPGAVDLTATTTAANGSIRWFANLTNTVPLATTSTFTTPYLTQNTTYYAAAVTNATTLTYNVGLPAFIQNFPYISTIAGEGLRFTVTNTCNIDSVGVYPIGTGTLSFAIYNAATQALVYTSPTSPVITGTGIEKRMISVGATGLAPGNYIIGIAAFNGLTNLRNEGFNPSAYPFTSPVLNITTGSAGFGFPTPNYYLFCYDWKVSAIGGCEGPRVPVTATINPSPVVAKTAPQVVCNNAVATITLTPPAPPYPNYTWTPTANLYTNAAATTPYTGGSATTLYMKTTNVGTQTYYMMAGNPAVTTGCTFADTVKIWVQPANVTIKGQPDTICVTGSSKLSLDTIAGYFPGSIQWQQSTDGVNYTDIAGATNPVYNTPVLSFGQNTYYKANIKAGTATCQTPVKYIVVSNPIIISAPDSFNCGPGTVTLSAQVGGNANARWYDSPTASIPVGSGSPWTTPFLGATTTYYVEAGTGSVQPAPTFIGNGTSISSGPPLAYGATLYTAQKVQWLITATELQAAGFNSGLITAIGFDVTTKSGNTNISSLSYSMKAIAGTLGTSLQTGMQTVFSTTNYDPTANTVNTHTLQSPFYWDGVSNLVVEECSYNPTNQFGSVNVKYNTSGPCLVSYTTTTGTTALNMCTAPVAPLALSYRPNIRFTLQGGCQSGREPVIAYIRPVPEVDLGPDINKCVDAGYAEVLDAGVQPNTPQFLWDNNSTSQVRAVNTTGTYAVKVTNQYGCSDRDTINVILRANPIVELGNDTTVCNGVVLNLNPGNGGIEYFWNTGQTTQSININTPGTYSVFVTNSVGCTKTDTITVNMQGELPMVQGISVTNNGQYTFHFTAVNPQNVIGYDWDFGDGSAHSYQASPSHTYPDAGNYIVVLHLSSSCGFINDSTSAHILGINQLNINKEELTVYPNPAKATATVLNRGALKMERIEVYNILGQVVYKSKADSKDKHTLNLDGFASGVYTIQVYTDKGTVARKLEIIK